MSVISGSLEKNYSDLELKRNLWKKGSRNRRYVLRSGLLVIGLGVIIIEVLTAVNTLETIGIKNLSALNLSALFVNPLTPFSLFLSYNSLSSIESFFLIVGSILIIVGATFIGLLIIIKPRNPAPPLTREEKGFLEVYDVIKTIDYSLAGNKAARLHAAGELSGLVEADDGPFTEKVLGSDALKITKQEVFIPLSRLRRRISQRLIPALKGDEIQEIRTALECLVKLADYLARPTRPRLDAFNYALRRLPISPTKDDQKWYRPRISRNMRSVIFLFAIDGIICAVPIILATDDGIHLVDILNIVIPIAIGIPLIYFAAQIYLNSK